MAVTATDGEFEAFTRATRRWLHQQAYRLCGDWHEADDLVQMAMWKIYRRWPELRRRGELKAYARQVVMSSFLTERRRWRWRHELTTPTVFDLPQVQAGLGAVEERTVLVSAMRQLGPRQQAVLSLRFFEDLSVEQTARVLGCAPGTVRSQTVRALTTLRRELASGEGDLPPEPEGVVIDVRDRAMFSGWPTLRRAG
jgi:RNA polymerase sigma-70 factor (sigma-E family)